MNKVEKLNDVPEHAGPEVYQMVPGLLAGPIGTGVVCGPRKAAGEHEWLTMGEVAYILRLSPTTIREAISLDGCLPTV